MSESESLAETIARIALVTKQTVAVAESLTGGALSSALARAPEAGQWYAGGVTAYMAESKRRALGVPEGPVITSECATQMARGVRKLLGADLSVALTGVGGPGETEGRPPGTVYLALSSAFGERTMEARFEGRPEEVVLQSVELALAQLRGELLTVEFTRRTGHFAPERARSDRCCG